MQDKAMIRQLVQQALEMRENILNLSYKAGLLYLDHDFSLTEQYQGGQDGRH